MANPEHLAKLREGVKVWNQWRVETSLATPDLSRVDLSGADLRGANLSGAILLDARLRDANLYVADLRGAFLKRANLSGANLFGALLSGADLSGAILSSADLTGAILNRTDLSGAELKDMKMGYGLVANVDLTSVTRLETVQHTGPSSIGIDTIHQSKSDIPDIFLRGAGVPEPFITYIKSLVTNPIEFYSCFISYSTQDQQFAERLFTDLQALNVRCWYAPHHVRGGRKLHEQIDQAIRVHEKVLLILSSDSMKSEWVKTEIAKARKREVRENKQVLFPVRLVSFETVRDWDCFDADSGKDSAREIREYFIPDFSDWKNHDKYDEAFKRLLQDLMAVK